MGYEQIQETQNTENTGSYYDKKISVKEPMLFAHWRSGMKGAFVKWKRCELRGSRTVLREVGAEML